ncbi:lipoprotein [Streptomyces sp. NPDC001348]
MGAVRGRVVPVVLLAAVLGGCAGSPDGEDVRSSPSASTTGGDSGTATGEVTESGGRTGAAGSACELPVTFDVAKGWKAKAIEAEADASGAAGDLADALLHQGPVTAVCEIDAKPAGHIGFLRVWKGKPGGADARAVLRAFVAAEDNTGKEKYRAFRTGGVSGVEVDYVYTSKLLGESKKETALAVTTPHGPVVLHLGGLDTEEHEKMRPAYELAKRTLRIV